MPFGASIGAYPGLASFRSARGARPDGKSTNPRRETLEIRPTPSSPTPATNARPGWGALVNRPPLTIGPTGAPVSPMLKKSPLTAANAPADPATAESVATPATAPAYSSPARTAGSSRSTRNTSASIGPPEPASRMRISTVPGPTGYPERLSPGAVVTTSSAASTATDTIRLGLTDTAFTIQTHGARPDRALTPPSSPEGWRRPDALR
jgi:hypothetical protein